MNSPISINLKNLSNLINRYIFITREKQEIIKVIQKKLQLGFNIFPRKIEFKESITNKKKHL